MKFGFLFLFIFSIYSIKDNIADESSPTSEPSPTPAGHPPSALVVWLTSIAGVVIIGCTVLVLCLKKQPDDMLFDTPKDHLNNIATLNTIQSFNDNDAINTPLMFTPEGSLN